MASHRKHELLTIPVEMFVRIAWQIPPEDLATFRLTCKYAIKNMSKVFAQVNFDEKAVLLSNVSCILKAFLWALQIMVVDCTGSPLTKSFCS